MKARTLLIAAVVVGCRQQARGVDTSGGAAAMHGTAAALPADTSHHAAAPAAPGAAPADSTHITRSGATDVGGPGAERPLPTRDREAPATRSATGHQVTREDTLRGTPAVVGTDRFNQVTLRPAGGGKAVVLAGAQARLVARASGADVWVAGTRRPDGQLEVSRFEVRAVDGAPAMDGTLEQSGGQYYLVTADGRRHVVNNVPVALRTHVGERVWMTGTLEKGPVTFGVLGRAG